MVVNQYECHTCGEIFSTQEALRVHNRSRHSEYECEKCGQLFFSQVELDTHLQKTHPGRKQIPTARLLLR